VGAVLLSRRNNGNQQFMCKLCVTREVIKRFKYQWKRIRGPSEERLGEVRVASCISEQTLLFHRAFRRFTSTFWRRNYFFLILAHPVYKM